MLCSLLCPKQHSTCADRFSSNWSEKGLVLFSLCRLLNHSQWCHLLKLVHHRQLQATCRDVACGLYIASYWQRKILTAASRVQCLPLYPQPVWQARPFRHSMCVADLLEVCNLVSWATHHFHQVSTIQLSLSTPFTCHFVSMHKAAKHKHLIGRSLKEISDVCQATFNRRCEDGNTTSLEGSISFWLKVRRGCKH